MSRFHNERLFMLSGIATLDPSLASSLPPLQDGSLPEHWSFCQKKKAGQSTTEPVSSNRSPFLSEMLVFEVEIMLKPIIPRHRHSHLFQRDLSSAR